MIIGGVDTSQLDDDFANSDSGRVLIMDGDGDAYRAAATVKTVPTGVRRFQSAVLEAIFLADCSTGEVYLTHEESFKTGRFGIKAVKPYQGQRNGSAKPPLLAAVREGAYEADQHPEFTVHMEKIFEADDAMMMRAYVEKENGVIRSDDKDLRMTPYAYYDIKTGKVLPPDPFGRLWIETTPSGKEKLVGHSLKFFWAQMMMGDTADNVKGLLKYKGKDCGLKGAYEALDPLTEIGQVCNHVIDAYREIDQNPLPEGWLLWMLRSPDDNVWRYFNELPWTEKNAEFLRQCAARDWFHKG